MYVHAYICDSVILFVSSQPLIVVFITISRPICPRFRLLATLVSLPPSVPHLNLILKSVGKWNQEKVLSSAIVVCPNIDKLMILRWRGRG